LQKNRFFTVVVSLWVRGVCLWVGGVFLSLRDVCCDQIYRRVLALGRFPSEVVALHAECAIRQRVGRRPGLSAGVSAGGYGNGSFSQIVRH
jgi:hypothetical protein